jgi:hypothetical protein
MYEVVKVEEFQLKARCSCGALEYSEIMRHEPTKGDEDIFTRRLMQRGWAVAPIMCRACRIRFMLQTVKDSLPGGKQAERGK